MNWIVIAIGTIFSSLFYWAGGRGRDFSKGFFFKSIIRDAGVSIVFLISYTLLSEIDTKTIICIFLSTIALFGSLTTYHKWLNRLFGRKNERLDFLNYGFHGACIGMAFIPMAFCGYSILLILLRVLTLLVLVGLFGLIKNAWISESLRGASIILSLLIFEVL